MNNLHFAGSDFVLSSHDISDSLLDALLDCGAPGDASEAVAFVRRSFDVTGDVAQCAAMLRGYGAWDETELADHDANLDRLVWLTGCALAEEGEAYFAAY